VKDKREMIDEHIDVYDIVLSLNEHIKLFCKFVSNPLMFSFNIGKDQYCRKSDANPFQ